MLFYNLACKNKEPVKNQKNGNVMKFMVATFDLPLISRLFVINYNNGCYVLYVYHDKPHIKGFSHAVNVILHCPMHDVHFSLFL